MAGYGGNSKQDRDVPADARNPRTSASSWAASWRSPTTSSPASSERESPGGRNSRTHPYTAARVISTRQWLDPRADTSVGNTENQSQKETAAEESLPGELGNQQPLQARDRLFRSLPKAISFFGHGLKQLGSVGLVIMSEDSDRTAGESLPGEPSNRASDAQERDQDMLAPSELDVFVLCHRRRDEDMKISCIGGQVRGSTNHARNSAALRIRVQHEASRHAWQKATLCLRKVDFRKWSWLQDNETELRMHGHFDLAIRFNGTIRVDELLTPHTTGTMTPDGLCDIPGAVPTGDGYN